MPDSSGYAAGGGRATAHTPPVTVRTVGVEEEFLLVDPATGRPRAVAHALLSTPEAEDAGDTVTGELHREQLETVTTPCRTLDELGVRLRAARATAAAAADDVGVALAPLATSPLPVEPTVSPSRRYSAMAARFGITASEQLTCGCHVHVAIESADEGVAALDRIRPWLAPLLAISANSPFWSGGDSGYCSYRAQLWQRWPSAGQYAPFGSAARYREFVDAALGTDTVLDEGMVYLDARLSGHHPTVEVRVADVCLEPDDAVVVAALTRALVQTAVDEWRAGKEPDPVRAEVLRLAAWRASRSGVGGELLDPRTWRPSSAADVLAALVERVTPALDEANDLLTVRSQLEAVLGRGTGAHRQRRVMMRTRSLSAVVRDATTGTPAR